MTDRPLELDACQPRRERGLMQQAAPCSARGAGMRNLILYTTDDGRSQIQLRVDLGTVWLSPLEMAELFQTSKQNVAKHLKAIFTEQELNQDPVVSQRLTTAADGKNYQVAHYSLNAILAVGYRVVHAASAMQSLARVRSCFGSCLSNIHAGYMPIWHVNQAPTKRPKP